MKDVDTILMEYCEADFNKRLNLYMEFPEFRRGFLAIDRADGADIAFRGDDKKTGIMKKLWLVPCAAIFSRIGRRWGF